METTTPSLEKVAASKATAAVGSAATVVTGAAAGAAKRLRGSVPSAIGIDVGARTIKAVQLWGPRWGGGPWTVWATAEVPRSEVADGAKSEGGASRRLLTRAEVGRLVGTLERQGFTGDRVVLAAPPEKLATSILDLPPRSSQAPLEQIAKMELARAHRFTPDGFEMGCWDLPAAARAARATPVMAVACTHADALAVIDPFEDEGLDAVALDVLPCALARACGPLIEDDGTGITGIVDLGWASADLILMHQGVVIYTRTLGDSGLSRLYQTLGARLGLESDVIDYLLGDSGLTQVSSEGGAPGAGTGAVAAARKGPNDAAGLIAAHFEAAVQELQVSLKYARHQYPDTPVSRLLMVGGGACIRGVSGHFSKTLGISARMAAPADLAVCAPHVAEACVSPALTAALGLAKFEAGCGGRN